MKQVLELTILGEPKAIQSVKACRFGKSIRTYQPAKVRDWKAFVRLAATEQLPKDWKILDEEVVVKYTYVFPMLKSMSKKVRQSIIDGAIIHKSTKPDLDNLGKGLSDSLTGVVWRDDSLVVGLQAVKIFGVNPHIKVRVYTVNDTVA